MLLHFFRRPSRERPTNEATMRRLGRRLSLTTAAVLVAGLFAANAGLGQSTQGPINNNHCDFFEGVGLKSVLVPVDHSGTHSDRELTYFYQAVESSTGTKNPKTVIYLTGGPGSGSIGTSGSGFLKKLRGVGLNLILIDPRGVACNGLKMGEVPDQVITTQQTALDIVEVIKAEGLRDYIVMGHSYGTMLGTVLTSSINQMPSIEQPDLLVLEGIFSRHLAHGAEYMLNEIDVLRNEMPKHFPAVKELLFSGVDRPPPFDLPFEYWIHVLEGYTRLGVETFVLLNPAFTRFADNYPDSLNDQKIKADLDRDYKDYLEYWEDTPPIKRKWIREYAARNYVYYSIMCKEMSRQDVGGFSKKMIDGQLSAVPNGSADVCDVFPFSDAPYDSKNYPISTPTLYFYGTSDGQTPKSYFVHHYDNSFASKEVVSVAGGGHGLFGMDLEVCTSQIWAQIADGRLDFTNILDQDGYCLRPD